VPLNEPKEEDGTNSQTIDLKMRKSSRKHLLEASMLIKDFPKAFVEVKSSN